MNIVQTPKREILPAVFKGHTGNPATAINTAIIFYVYFTHKYIHNLITFSIEKQWRAVRGSLSRGDDKKTYKKKSSLRLHYICILQTYIYTRAYT